MDDNRSAVVLCLAKRSLHVLKVVTVYRTDVLDVEIREDSGCRVAHQDSLSGSVNAIEDNLAQSTHLVEHALRERVALLVPGFGSNCVERLRQSTDGWGIRTTIVIHNDHKVAVVVISDVVQSLPGHTSGKRTVTDYGNNVSVLVSSCLECPRDSICPGQRTRGVRGLNNVMLGFRALWVTSDAILLPKTRQVPTSS